MQAETTTEKLSTWGLLWNIRLSALYHLKRERFLDGADKASKALSALGGAAAFSQLKTSPEFGLWVIGFITLVSTMSLVYSTSSKARKHAELARDFRRLEADILALGDAITVPDIAKFDSKRVSLEASEPASLGALVTQCHNELCESFGLIEQITKLGPMDRMFKNIIDIDQTIHRPATAVQH
jgi:hypothetical protein